MDVLTQTRAALPAPRIPLALDGGLGYDDVARTPDVSLVVQVGPWPDFQDGDTLQILWGATETVVATRPSSRADANTVVDAFVLARTIQNLGDGTHPVKARVTNSLGIPVTSPPTATLVKLSVPGGHDTDAHTPYANENLAPPVVDPDTIEPTTPSAVVTIAAYENMAAGDAVTVRWNVANNDIFHDVTAAEAGLPLSIPIDREALDAGGVGEALKITYQIYDLAHNWSLWSPHALVDVIDPDAPQAPWVEGTVDDAGEVLDVDALGSAALSVLVEGSGALKDDAVTVHWAGATAAGQPVLHETPVQQPTRPGQTLTFSVPNDKVKPLAQGSARAWYTIVPVDGSKTRTSARRNLSVIGQIVQLVRPGVAEAKGDTLDPADLTGDFAHATVPAWSGMQVGDGVSLVGEGRRANGELTQWTESRQVSGAMLDKDISIDIPRNIIDVLVDGSLRLYYLVAPFGTARQGSRVQRAARAALRSDNLDLAIRDASAQPQLPPPAMPELDNGVLDPDNPTTVHINIPAYTDIATKDRVDVALRGGIEPFDDWLPVASPANPPSFVLPKNIIDANRDQNLTVTYTVTRVSGGNARSQSLSFRIGAQAIVLLRPEPDFLEPEGRLDIDKITDPRGLRVLVKQYQGMAIGQKIALRCLSPLGHHYPAEQTVDRVRDFEFFIPKAYIQTIVDEVDPAIAGFDYTVTTGGGSTQTSPRNDVTFYGYTPLTIDRSTMYIVDTGSYRREATGGTPPYFYAALDPEIVEVFLPKEGWVRGKANGSTKVEVTDSADGYRLYPVEVNFGGSAD